MVLQSSGAISLAQIRDELSPSASNPRSISNYYLGGSFVTAATKHPNGIPSSGAIMV